MTPHARVAVHTSTLTTPALNMRSTSVRSERSMPALWQPKPLAYSSLSSGLRLRLMSDWNRFMSGCVSAHPKSSRPPSAFAANSASWRAVFTVSLRLCTNTIACFPLLSAARHLSYAISAISIWRFIALPSVTPTKTCDSGMGRKLWSNTNSPASVTPRKRATSLGLGSVADSPTMRIMLCVVSTWRCVRATA